MPRFPVSRLAPIRPGPPATDIVLGRRWLHVLPTREGMYYTAMVAVMLVAAINYANGLAYALTFLLASVGVVGILQTHRNLAGVRVAGGGAEPVFAGETAKFVVVLENRTRLPRYAVDVGIEGQVYRTDVPVRESVRIELSVPAAGRGYLDAPPVKVRTRFPLGLWRTWSRPLALPMRCLVYPRPGVAPPLPAIPDLLDAGDGPAGQEGDDFSGLRAFQVGDSMQRVVWKKVAAGQGWHTKQFASAAARVVWLRWHSLPTMPDEERLSALCRWVLTAEQHGVAYGLELPDRTVAPASGATHRDRCLEALALFQRRP